MATGKVRQGLLGKVTKNIEVQDINLSIATNGFVVKINGRDNNDDWQSTTIVCTSFDDLELLITDIKNLNG